MVYVRFGGRELFELWKTEYLSPRSKLRLVCIRNQDIYIGDPSLFDDEVSLSVAPFIDLTGRPLLGYGDPPSSNNATNLNQLFN